jgi:hypothetical protein
MPSSRYTPQTAGSAASKFGQMIGEAFERVVFEYIQSYLANAHADYEILAPEKGRQIVTLETLSGTPRRLDTVIVSKESIDPVALLETKWLKDARHHNDKGAWILQLREVSRQYPTVRGAAAVLAGYWTEGVGIMLASNAKVKMVLVATDSEVYSTLQLGLNAYLGAESFELNPVIMRQSYPNAHLLANFLIELEERDQLDTLAATWLNFTREVSADGKTISGADKINHALDDLLSPLPANPNIQKFEIGLEISTGNMIYEEFDDVEALIEFIKSYYGNPQAILNRISPRKNKGEKHD